MGGARRWWEDAVFYQIYPRSFMDSDGDGVGDLPGIESRLDHVSRLGADALWISPFFKSPMRDFGYDISDYRDVDPLFGSLADLRRLLDGARARGIRVVLDLVANHSSDEHPWFVEARSSRESSRHGWYLWVPDAGRPPNNWMAKFELGTAWHPNPATGERYLGTFTRFQPEFDWRNPELRREIYDVMRFWFDLGVDGFRLDVATGYAKDELLRSNPFKANLVPDILQSHVYDRNMPAFHDYFKEMRRVADEAGDRLLIGETHGEEAALAAASYGEALDELHMAFNFDFLHRPWSAESFRSSAEAWYALLPEGAWPNFTLSNHDQPRHAWRYRGRLPGPRGAAATDGRARIAAAMLLTIRGTPFLYYGEEIGMTCRRIPRRALRDPLGIATWPLGFLGRDTERTPMQWDASRNAGFTSGEPWLPLNPDYAERNVAAQEADPGSLLSWYRRLIGLRRSRAALREGEISFLDLGAGILAYRRRSEGDEVLVALNFRSSPATAAPGIACRVLAGTSRQEGETLPGRGLRLGPLEAVVAEPLGGQAG